MVAANKWNKHFLLIILSQRYEIVTSLQTKTQNFRSFKKTWEQFELRQIEIKHKYFSNLS